MKRLKKTKKIKKQKTFKLIDKVLNQKCHKDEALIKKIDACFEFIHSYEHDNFEQVIEVLFKDADIKSKLGFFQTEKCNLLNVTIIDVNSLKMKKFISILKVILNSNIGELKEFSDCSSEIEWLLIHNKTKEIINILDYLDDKYRVTLWSINLRMICMTLEGCDTSDLYQLHSEYSSVNKSELLLDSLECMMERNTVSDVLSYIETNSIPKIKELNEGNAQAFAAYFLLLTGGNNLDNELMSTYSLPLLTMLPLYDAYNFAIKAISNDFINDSLKEEPDFSKLLSQFINAIDINKLLPEVTKLKCLINEGDGIKDSVQDNAINDVDYLNYCKGNFNEVISNFERNLAEDRNILSKINLIAKSYIKADRLPVRTTPTLLHDFLTNLIKIYQLDNSNQCIRNVLSLAYRFNLLNISYHLIVSIIKSAPYYFNENIFHAISKRACLSIIPVTKMTLRLEDKFILQGNINNSEKSSYLLIKEKLCNELKKDSNRETQIESLLKLINKATSVRKDYLELKFEYLIKYQKYSEAIELSVESLTRNKESAFCIPMNKIAEIIETGEYTSINSVIFSYFFESKHRMKSEDLLKESFEELLMLHDDMAPSQILESMKELTELEIYFFLNVCTTKLISYQGIYETPSELSMERLNILNQLVTKDNVNNDVIDELVRDCMDEIIISEGLTRMSNSRVNLGIPELTHSVSDKVKSLVKTYNNEEEGGDSNTIYPLKESKAHLVVAGAKNHLIKKIFNLIRLEFLDNPDYGLDKILSSRIRHSFFSDEISRKAIDKKIIVEFDKNGDYEDRSYWMEKYNYVNSHILKDTNKILDKFSIEFYLLIDEAENWMKISKNGELVNSEFDFQFSIDISYFNEVEEQIENGNSIDFICNYIFNIYKDSLKSKLKNMRLRLRVDLSDKMDLLFEKLINDIDFVRRNVAYNELLEAINYVKNGVQDDIKTSSEWFSIDDNKYEERAIEISKLITISKIFLERSSGKSKGLELYLNSDYLIDSKQTSHVNLSIINLLSNSFKYVKKGTLVGISIEDQGESGFIMIISNQVEEDVLLNLKSGHFDELLITLASKNSLELLKTEGGTGLFKSLYELKLASKKFNLNINLNMDRFNVEITYDE